MKYLLTAALAIVLAACDNTPKDPATEVKPTTVEVNEKVMMTTGELAIAFYPTEEEIKTTFKDTIVDMAAFDTWFTNTVEPVFKEKGVKVVKSNQENMMLEISEKERFTMYRPGAKVPFGLFVAKSGYSPLVIKGLISKDDLVFKLNSLVKK